MMRRELKAALAAGLAATVALTGCVQFKGEVKGKEIAGDQVRLSFSICSDGGFEECLEEPTETRRGGEDSRFILIGLRLPKGVDAPSRLKPEGVNFPFKPNLSYTRQLNRKAPTPSGQKWRGYASKQWDSESYPSSGKFRVTVGLPRNAGSKFLFNAVVGHASRPAPLGRVNCGQYPFESQGDEFGTDCIDDEAKNLDRNIKVPLD